MSTELERTQAIILREAPAFDLDESQKVDLFTEIMDLLGRTEGVLSIVTDAQFVAAGEQLKEIAALKKRVTTEPMNCTLTIGDQRYVLEMSLDDLREAYHGLHKAVLKTIGQLTDDLTTREDAAGRAMTAFRREQDRLERQRAQKEREEAAERQRQADAEALRLAKEKQAAEAETARQAQLAQAAKDAEELRAAGQAEAAAAVEQHAEENPPEPPPLDVRPAAPVAQPAPPREAPKAAGVAVAKTPKWEWAMRCEHDKGDGKDCPVCQSIPRKYLKLDRVMVNSDVRNHGDKVDLPFINVWPSDRKASVRPGSGKTLQAPTGSAKSRSVPTQTVSGEIAHKVGQSAAAPATQSDDSAAKSISPAQWIGMLRSLKIMDSMDGVPRCISDISGRLLEVHGTDLICQFSGLEGKEVVVLYEKIGGDSRGYRAVSIKSTKDLSSGSVPAKNGRLF
jgi:chemotaxis protein histidine kinase CheA